MKPAFPKPAFPKPSQVRRKVEPVTVYDDGREVCNLRTRGGKAEYKQRTMILWARQQGYCPLCHKRLALAEATFDHQTPRGMGGGSRDDRLWRFDTGNPLGVWQNQAVHGACNGEKGSRRI